LEVVEIMDSILVKYILQVKVMMHMVVVVEVVDILAVVAVMVRTPRVRQEVLDPAAAALIVQ
jgi:hypothetical protein